MSLILASQSPRRQELLRQAGISDFLVIPARGEEIMDPALSAGELVETLSMQKAAEVAAARPAEDIVLGADTIVVLDGSALGKPADPEDAMRMLRALSGRTHQVYTGVTVQRGEACFVAHEVTDVTFRPVTEAELRRYVSTGEPLDKAGAYGIQGFAARFISGIRGDYSNVVGLPICTTVRLLEHAGYPTL